MTDDTEEQLAPDAYRTDSRMSERLADLAQSAARPRSHPFIATSVAEQMLTWGDETLRRRGISAIVGPYGIGKTETCLELAERHPGEVAVVTLPPEGRTSPNALIKLMLESVMKLCGYKFGVTPSGDSFMNRKRLYNLLCRRADVDPEAARRGRYGPEAFPPLMIAIDEVQNALVRTLEVTRGWNDPAVPLGPAPIAFFFVGNPLFDLKPGDEGNSPISKALGDRLLFSRELGYRDVTDADLRAFARTQGDFSEVVLDYVVEAHRGKHATRSLRLLQLALDQAGEYADGGIVRPAHVKRALLRQVNESRRAPLGSTSKGD